MAQPGSSGGGAQPAVSPAYQLSPDVERGDHAHQPVPLGAAPGRSTAPTRGGRCGGSTSAGAAASASPSASTASTATSRSSSRPRKTSRLDQGRERQGRREPPGRAAVVGTHRLGEEPLELGAPRLGRRVDGDRAVALDERVPGQVPGAREGLEPRVDRARVDVGPLVDPPGDQLAADLVAVDRLEQLHGAQEQHPGRGARHARSLGSGASSRATGGRRRAGARPACATIRAMTAQVTRNRHPRHRPRAGARARRGPDAGPGPRGAALPTTGSRTCWRWPTRCGCAGAAPRSRSRASSSLKTGGCPEDCHFCSQSGQFTSPVRSVWLDIPELVAAAKQTAATGATEFCIVAAVRGPDERLMAQVREGVAAIRDAVDINVAASLGMLTQEQVDDLADMGVHRYNHNLETARSYFPNVVTTHTWEERWDTCRWSARPAWSCAAAASSAWARPLEQRAELAAQLAELEPARGAAELPQPAPRHAVRRPASRWTPATRCAPSRRSGWPCRAPSCATPAAASSPSATSAPATACSAASTP